MHEQMIEDKSKRIKRIEIEPAEQGFFYTVFVKPEKKMDEKDAEMLSEFPEPLKYALASVDEVAAAVKDDLSSPHAREAPLGSGQRFAALKNRIESRPGFESRNPGQSKDEAAAAIAASIGRKKYGSQKFAQLALKGRRS